MPLQRCSMTTAERGIQEKATERPRPYLLRNRQHSPGNALEHDAASFRATPTSLIFAITSLVVGRVLRIQSKRQRGVGSGREAGESCIPAAIIVTVRYYR